MEDFDTIIKPYATKVVDPTNEDLVDYKIVYRVRRRTIDIRTHKSLDVNRVRKVRTPDGVFDSITAAGKHYGLSAPGVFNRIKKQLYGWEYE